MTIIDIHTNSDEPAYPPGSEVFHITADMRLEEQLEYIRTVNDAVEARYARLEFGVGVVPLTEESVMFLEMELTKELSQQDEVFSAVTNIIQHGRLVDVYLKVKSHSSNENPELRKLLEEAQADGTVSQS